MPVPLSRIQAGSVSAGNLPVVFLGSDTVLVLVMWYYRVNERRLDYRSLAEALRVRVFWAIGGIGASVVDSYLRQMRGEMAWARRALRSSAPPPSLWRESFSRQSAEIQLKKLQWVRLEWVRIS